MFQAVDHRPAPTEHRVISILAPSAKSYPLLINGGETIIQVKSKLAESMGLDGRVQPQRLQLMFMGRRLEDRHSLGYYGINNGMVLQLFWDMASEEAHEQQKTEAMSPARGVMARSRTFSSPSSVAIDGRASASANTLPDTVLARIFSYLSLSDFMSVGVVCRRWRMAARMTRPRGTLVLRSCFGGERELAVRLQRILSLWPSIRNLRLPLLSNILVDLLVGAGNGFGLDFLHMPNIRDLHPLARCRGHSIYSLDLSFTGVHDIHPLSALRFLSHLNLRGTSVSDIKPLLSVDLVTLNLAETPVQNLTPLARRGRLTRLDLGGSQVTDITPLKGCTSLRHLFLWLTGVKQVDPLASCRQLHTLNLSKTPVESVLPLAQCRNLTVLDLSSTRVQNDDIVDVVRSWNNVRVLRLSSGEVRIKQTHEEEREYEWGEEEEGPSSAP